MSSAAKAAAARRFGAAVAIDYTQDDFVAATKEATGGKGADVVLCFLGGWIHPVHAPIHADVALGFLGGWIHPMINSSRHTPRHVAAPTVTRPRPRPRPRPGPPSWPGGDYTPRNVSALAPFGRLVQLGLRRGQEVTFDFKVRRPCKAVATYPPRAAVTPVV